jgi:hypothetical protein
MRRWRWIRPSVRAFRLQHRQRFAEIEEAMNHFRHQYGATTEEQEAIAPQHLGRVLQEENGGFSLPASSIRVKIWWEIGSGDEWAGRNVTEGLLSWGKGRGARSASPYFGPGAILVKLCFVAWW